MLKKLIIIISLIIFVKNSISAQVFVGDRSYDFGVVENWDNPKAVFPIVNKGSKPFMFLSAFYEEDLRVEFEPRMIQPGETTMVYVTYYTIEAGRFSRDFKLSASTTDKPLELNIRGTIRSFSPNAITVCPRINNEQQKIEKLKDVSFEYTLKFYDIETNEPVKDVDVKVQSTISKDNIKLETNKRGEVKMNADNGTYSVKATKSGYKLLTQPLVVTSSRNETSYYLVPIVSALGKKDTEKPENKKDEPKENVKRVDIVLLKENEKRERNSSENKPTANAENKSKANDKVVNEYDKRVQDEAKKKYSQDQAERERDRAKEIAKQREEEAKDQVKQQERDRERAQDQAERERDRAKEIAKQREEDAKEQAKQQERDRERAQDQAERERDRAKEIAKQHEEDAKEQAKQQERDRERAQDQAERERDRAKEIAKQREEDAKQQERDRERAQDQAERERDRAKEIAKQREDEAKEQAKQQERDRERAQDQAERERDRAKEIAKQHEDEAKEQAKQQERDRERAQDQAERDREFTKEQAEKDREHAKELAKQREENAKEQAKQEAREREAKRERERERAEEIAKEREQSAKEQWKQEQKEREKNAERERQKMREEAKEREKQEEELAKMEEKRKQDELKKSLELKPTVMPENEITKKRDEVIDSKSKSNLDFLSNPKPKTSNTSSSTKYNTPSSSNTNSIAPKTNTTNNSIDQNQPEKPYNQEYKPITQSTIRINSEPYDSVYKPISNNSSNNSSNASYKPNNAKTEPISVSANSPSISSKTQPSDPNRASSSDTKEYEKKANPVEAKSAQTKEQPPISNNNPSDVKPSKPKAKSSSWINAIVENEISVDTTSQKLIVSNVPKLSYDLYKGNNVMLLIDVSKSMKADNKFQLLKQSMFNLIASLRQIDTVSIMAFNTQSFVVVEPQTADNLAYFQQVLDTLQPKGQTFGVLGLEKAYNYIESKFLQNGNNQLIIATDGAFNGPTYSRERLQQIIQSKASRGIKLSVLAFGIESENKELAKNLARHGNGNYLEVKSAIQANQILIDEIKEQSKR